MTMTTWLEEFYPTSASASASTDLSAAEHSLQKWRGLTTGNLAKHDVVRLSVYVKTPGGTTDFTLRSETCALCVRAKRLSERNSDPATYCKACVLYKSRGNVSCEHVTPMEDISPWDSMRMHGNVKPMIEALEAAVECAKAGL